MAIFIASYVVIRKYLIEPLDGILVERDTEIRDAESRYEDALAKFNGATSEMESRVLDAKKKASGIREEHRTEATAHRNDVIRETRAKAESIMTEAEAKLENEVVEAREKIDREADSLAQLAAERILGRKLA